MKDERMRILRGLEVIVMKSSILHVANSTSSTQMLDETS